MKSSLSSGCDEISSKVIKDLKFILVPILTHIFNISIVNENYPHLAKMLKVLPFPKKDKNVTNREDYRDINLANIIPKIFDKKS